jgi:hypothetical protein
MQVVFAQLQQSSYRPIHSPGGDPTKKYVEQRSLPTNLSIILFQYRLLNWNIATSWKQIVGKKMVVGVRTQDNIG